MALTETKGSVLSRIAYYAQQLTRQAIQLEDRHWHSFHEEPEYLIREIERHQTLIQQELLKYRAMLDDEAARMQQPAAE